jgi:membrane protein
VIVLMLWLYWSGMVLLLGAEINAEIDYAATDPPRPPAADTTDDQQAA